MGKSYWMASLDQVLQRAYQIQHLCGLGRRWVEGLGLKVCHVGCLGLSPLSRWPLVRLRDVMNPTEDVEKDSLSIKRGENQMKQLLAVTQFQSECRWINLLIDSNRGPPWPRINYNRSPLPDCSRYANPCAILGRNKRASAVKCVLLLKSIVVGISGALVGEQQSTGIFYDRQPLKQRFSTLLIAFHRLMVGWGTAGIRLSWWF